MIRTLPVNCAPILACSKGDGKTATKTASDEIAITAVHALGEFSLLVSQHNYSDPSLTELDDTLNRL